MAVRDLRQPRVPPGSTASDPRLATHDTARQAQQCGRSPRRQGGSRGDRSSTARGDVARLRIRPDLGIARKLVALVAAPMRRLCASRRRYARSPDRHRASGGVPRARCSSTTGLFFSCDGLGPWRLLRRLARRLAPSAAWRPCASSGRIGDSRGAGGTKPIQGAHETRDSGAAVDEMRRTLSGTAEMGHSAGCARARDALQHKPSMTRALTGVVLIDPFAYLTRLEVDGPSVHARGRTLRAAGVYERS